jgi:C4-dicarboxylate-specific signal transduction histidine kinase
MNASLKNHNIDIKTHIEETPLQVKIIAQELDQVIINILNNAKDALNERDIQDSWIHIDLHSQDQKIILTIEDNAGGVNETVKTHMFEPYFTTKHKSQGTGLGLHMSYKIVTESFGGNLYMQNTTNGAKFFIEIPLKSDK